MTIPTMINLFSLFLALIWVIITFDIDVKVKRWWWTLIYDWCEVIEKHRLAKHDFDGAFQVIRLRTYAKNKLTLLDI